MFQVLHEIPIDSISVKTIKQLFKEPSAKIKIEDKLSAQFNITKDLEQGRSFSPNVISYLPKYSIASLEKKIFQNGHTDRQKISYTLYFTGTTR